jgi:hypothetical protein
MTSVTDTDLRDLKVSIDTLAKVVKTIAKATEANTLAISTLSSRIKSGYFNPEN